MASAQKQLSLHLSLEPTEAIPNQYVQKHPLQHTWALWYDTPRRRLTKASWSDNLNKIYSFSTVEDFWCLWNNIKGAHELSPGSNYHLFKDGIEPKWEDPANARGGKWIVQVKVTQRSTLLNQLWLWLVLACIGYSFEDDDEICGVVVCVRKAADKICLCTRNAHDVEACQRIGKQFKEILGTQYRLVYQLHNDALHHNSSFNN